MATTTPRRGLILPAPSESVDIEDINTNMRKLDQYSNGPIPCLSTARPNNPAIGDTIFETDTLRSYTWGGTGYGWIIGPGIKGFFDEFTIPSTPATGAGNQVIFKRRWAPDDFEAIFSYDLNLRMNVPAANGLQIFVDICETLANYNNNTVRGEGAINSYYLSSDHASTTNIQIGGSGMRGFKKDSEIWGVKVSLARNGTNTGAITDRKSVV